MELTKESLQPLPLGEQGWVELGGKENVRVRIDYMTQSEDSEHRRLNRLWLYGLNDPDEAHPEEFFLLASIKDLAYTGEIKIDGIPYVFQDNKVSASRRKSDPVNVVNILKGLGLYDLALIKIRALVHFGPTDKKKPSSSPTPSPGENSSGEMSSVPEKTGSSTAGTQATKTGASSGSTRKSRKRP